MRCSVVTAYVTMMVAMTLIGYGPMPTWAQGQSQPPSFVDERRLPDFGGVLSKEQQSGEQLSAETEARRKAAEEEAARQKSEEQERARQAA
ncbi:MAG TPA: hypothetical protein P5114_01345, partial [Hyphomicrobiaceae bacterium]|nr:hypothetical protein [Hyphomicrobiaceae bacterium]